MVSSFFNLAPLRVHFLSAVGELGEETEGVSNLRLTTRNVLRAVPPTRTTVAEPPGLEDSDGADDPNELPPDLLSVEQALQGNRGDSGRVSSDASRPVL